MALATPRWARPLLVSALTVALGWPTTARARHVAPDPAMPEAGEMAAAAREPEPTAPEAGAPEGSVDGEAPVADPETDPTALTPEQLAQRQLQAKVEQATAHYKEGQRLYGNGLYAEAAVEFERSYASVPAADTLYAISLAHGRAGKSVEAVRALERYLKLDDCNALPAAKRTIECASKLPTAREALDEQRRKVGELALKVAEGVELREVRVAGRTVPLDDFPLLMLPGTVDVELFGMGPEDRRTRPAYITAGEVYEVYVAPWKTDDAVPPSSPEIDPGQDDPRRSEQQQRRLRIAFWTGLGLTAASGVALGVMGGLTRYHERRFDIERCRMVCSELDEDGQPVLDENGNPMLLDMPYPFDHERLFERYKPITNALIGVTAGLAVGTALVGAFAFRRRDAEQGRWGTARIRVRMGAPGLVVRW